MCKVKEIPGVLWPPGGLRSRVEETVQLSTAQHTRGTTRNRRIRTNESSRRVEEEEGYWSDEVGSVVSWPRTSPADTGTRRVLKRVRFL